LWARKQLQRSTLSVLARRLERNQPFSRRNRAFAVAIRGRAPARRLEHLRRHRGEPVGFLTMPAIELFDVQNEVRQNAPCHSFAASVSCSGLPDRASDMKLRASTETN
jgi:hypothetical protein